MQFTEIFNLLLEFFTSAIFIFALLMIVCVGAFRYSTRSKTSAGVPVSYFLCDTIVITDAGAIDKSCQALSSW